MKLKKGQRIRTVYGDWATVLRQWDNMILTYEIGYVHIDKVIAVK